MPIADKQYTNSSSKAYVSFKVPDFKLCWDGNWLGWGFIPGGCKTFGGKTYSGATGKDVTATGIYNVQITINAANTQCTQSVGSLTTAGTVGIHAYWPKIQVTASMNWYPMAGGSLGVGIQTTIEGLNYNMQGTLSTQTTLSDNSACLTSFHITNSVITFSSISGNWVINRLGNAIYNAGTKITNTINNATAPLVGQCATPKSPSPAP
eukprot:scaffold5.g987.t1